MTNSRTNKNILKETTGYILASNVITILSTDTWIEIDTEASASTDNLDTINGGVKGQIIRLHQVSTARDITVRDDGNIKTQGSADHDLKTTWSYMTLINATGSEWHELSHSVNTP